MSDTNVLHLIMCAFRFPEVPLAGKRTNSVRYRKDIEIARKHPFPPRKRYPPPVSQNCSPFSAYLIAPGNLWLFRARYALPRFRKGFSEGHVSNTVDHILEQQQERLKIIRLLLTVYPWYSVGKFLESNCTVATSNE